MYGYRGYNIVILPSEEIKNQSIVWSKELAQHWNTKFSLDGKQYHPHITVYQSNFLEEDSKLLLARLQKLTQTLKQFSILLNTIGAYEDFVFYFVEKNNILQSTHETILNQVSSLHDPAYTIPPDMKNFSPILARNINRYGTGLAMEDYLPHITLTRCNTKEEAKKAAESIQAKKLTMNVDAIYLTNVDHDGTCTKILEKFSLPTLSSRA